MASLFAMRSLVKTARLSGALSGAARSRLAAHLAQGEAPPAAGSTHHWPLRVHA